MDKINLGMIGVGRWGSNLLRTFVGLADAKVRICCDTDHAQLQLIHKQYPSIKTTKNIWDVLTDPSIDAVVIAVNTSNHFDIAYSALNAGKAVFVEKPMCDSAKEAKLLYDKSKSEDLILMVGHVFLYHPAVTRIKELITKGKLGEIHTIHSRRLNWGRVRQDENVLSSLIPHDISIMFHLFDKMPTEIQASGISYLQEKIEDTAIVSLKFPDNKIGFIHVSWFDPEKERKTTVIGSLKTAVFDDMKKDSKLTIYEGDRKVECPILPETEPLTIECQHFINCVRKNLKPISNGQNGVDVVRVIESAQESLQKHSFVKIEKE